jgi:hypothetical protein
MPSLKPPKKSETIEIRLPHATKTAFAARCQADGRTVSEAVRGFIDGELVASNRSSRSGRQGVWRLLAAAVAGLVVGGVAAPSLAHPVLNARAVFDGLDRNHHGVLNLNACDRR